MAESRIKTTKSKTLLEVKILKSGSRRTLLFSKLLNSTEVGRHLTTGGHMGTLALKILLQPRQSRTRLIILLTILLRLMVEPLITRKNNGPPRTYRALQNLHNGQVTLGMIPAPFSCGKNQVLLTAKTCLISPSLQRMRTTLKQLGILAVNKNMILKP